MGIASVILGGLGIVLIGLSIPVNISALFFGGIAVGIISVVLGIAARKSGAGKAGLALGLLCTVGAGFFILMFSGRAVKTSSGPVQVGPTTAPAR